MNVQLKRILLTASTVLGLALLTSGFVLGFGLRTHHAATQTPTIRIVSPQQNSSVVAGQTLTIIIEPNAGTTLQRASAWLIPISNVPQTVTSAPFHIQVQVPEDRLGPATLKAVALDTNGKSLQASLQIIITSPSDAQDIFVQPEEMLFFKAGESMQIGVSALFNNDVRRDVTKSPDTSYSSTNPRVAAVSFDGRVEAIAPGISTIEIRNRGFSKMINVNVGSFELRGDLDGDSDIDQNDLRILQAALNMQATGPNDPRDLNDDGVINDLDLQLLTGLCSRPECLMSIGPSINSVVFDGKKTLTIDGNKFSSTPRVFINATEKTGFMQSASDTLIKLKAKAKKLGLKSGDNNIQITDATGATSNLYTLRL